MRGWWKGRRRAPRGLARHGALVMLAAALPLAPAACRDATEPFRAEDQPPDAGPFPRPLTRSALDDRAPAWSTGGDTVYYAAEGFDPLPRTPGLLLRVPAAGGVAEALLPELQFPSGSQRWFTSPAPSPDGSRLAWVELWSVAGENLCPGTTPSCTPAGAAATAPRLQEMFVRVAERGAPAGSGPSLAVSFDGAEFVPTAGGGLPGYFVVRYHPFHQLFNAEARLVFRPAWSPDGTRLALSDGLRLLVWQPGQEAATPVPGTEDGVSPAWSPDGEWIAYTRLVRGPPLEATCLHVTFLGPACEQRRTVHPVEGRMLVLVRPDGSETRELVEGEEPAWTPDGARLVFSRPDGLWVMAADGSGARPLEGTQGGREPAVSPAGRHVAYVRPGVEGGFDVWIAELEP